MKTLTSEKNFLINGAQSFKQTEDMDFLYKIENEYSKLPYSSSLDENLPSSNQSFSSPVKNVTKSQPVFFQGINLEDIINQFKYTPPTRAQPEMRIPVGSLMVAKFEHDVEMFNLKFLINRNFLIEFN